MTRAEALQIVDRCEHWNTAQTSVSLAFRGKRTDEDDVLDERRKTLAEAWRVLRGASE